MSRCPWLLIRRDHYKTNGTDHSSKHVVMPCGHERLLLPISDGLTPSAPGREHQPVHQPAPAARRGPTMRASRSSARWACRGRQTGSYRSPESNRPTAVLIGEVAERSPELSFDLGVPSLLAQHRLSRDNVRHGLVRDRLAPAGCKPKERVRTSRDSLRGLSSAAECHQDFSLVAVDCSVTITVIHHDRCTCPTNSHRFRYYALDLVWRHPSVFSSDRLSAPSDLKTCGGQCHRRRQQGHFCNLPSLGSPRLLSGLAKARAGEALASRFCRPPG